MQFFCDMPKPRIRHFVRRERSLLDEASKQRIRELCEQIANEQDRNRFSMLVSELNQLLDAAESATQRSRTFPPPASENSSEP